MGYLYPLFGFQPKLSARLFGRSERTLLQPKSEPDSVCQILRHLRRSAALCKRRAPIRLTTSINRSCKGLPRPGMSPTPDGLPMLFKRFHADFWNKHMECFINGHGVNPFSPFECADRQRWGFGRRHVRELMVDSGDHYRYSKWRSERQFCQRVCPGERNG